MVFSTSVRDTISTVVCIYLRGRDISAEAVPMPENANASVSVPVDEEWAHSWYGMSSVRAVSSIICRRWLCTDGARDMTGPSPQRISPSVILFMPGVDVSCVTSVTMATSGAMLRAIILAPFIPTSSCTVIKGSTYVFVLA